MTTTAPAHVEQIARQLHAFTNGGAFNDEPDWIQDSYRARATQVLQRVAQLPAAVQPPATIGYVIAERRIYGLHAGELAIDWDGKVHEALDSATAELAEANRPSEDDPTQTPADHWKLYELREVQP